MESDKDSGDVPAGQPPVMGGDEAMCSNDGGGGDDDVPCRPSEEGAGKSSAGEQMDVEVYSALYSGRMKVVRLIFIAERCGNQAMELDALRLAHDEIRKGEDTNLYREVVSMIAGRLGPKYELDQALVDTVDRRAKPRKEKLENELDGYKKSCP